MVVLAVKLGYSAAFGAFMMGSIFAETVEADAIERLVDPVKNLFRRSVLRVGGNARRP